MRGSRDPNPWKCPECGEEYIDRGKKRKVLYDLPLNRYSPGANRNIQYTWFECAECGTVNIGQHEEYPLILSMDEWNPDVKMNFGDDVVPSHARDDMENELNRRKKVLQLLHQSPYEPLALFDRRNRLLLMQTITSECEYDSDERYTKLAALKETGKRMRMLYSYCPEYIGELNQVVQS